MSATGSSNHLLSRLDSQGERMLVPVDSVRDPDDPAELLLFMDDPSAAEMERRRFWADVFWPLEWCERGLRSDATDPATPSP